MCVYCVAARTKLDRQGAREYLMPTISCENRYGLSEFGRRISSATTSETKGFSQEASQCCGLVRAYVHVVGRIIVVHEREKKDCRFLRPETSTQRGPIVWVELELAIARLKQNEQHSLTPVVPYHPKNS